MTLNDLEKLVSIKNLHTDVGSAMAIIDACSDEDVKNKLDFLKEYGIVLNELKDLRVLLVPLNQIQAKIRNLEEANALDLARQRPSVLTSNDSCLSICNRINICIQDGIEYKDANGNYYPFIWNKREWDKKYAETKHNSNLSADEIFKDFDKETNRKVGENLNQANEIIAEQNEKEISEILNNTEEYREPDILADVPFEPVEDIKPVDPSEALAAIEEQRKALEAAKKEALGTSRDELNKALNDELNFLDFDAAVDDNKLGGR